MGKQDKRHELAITDASGNEIGLTLYRKNGVPAYTETTDPAVAQQFWNGDIEYARLPPEKELAITQSDYRKGFGHEYFEENGHYFYGINADLRHKDGAILNALPATITKVTLPTLVDGEMDVWTDVNTLTNWTEGGDGTLTKEATTKYSGSYSAYCQGNGAGAITLTQTLTGWSNTFRNKLITVTIWCKKAVAGAAADVTLTINDGIGTTAVNGQATTNWHQIVCSRSLAATATKIDLLVTVANSINAYIDLAQIATWGAVTAQADFNGDHYIASGAVLSHIDHVAGAHHFCGIMPATITDLFAASSSSVDYLFICLGWGNAYYYMTATPNTITSNATSGQKDVIVTDGNLFYIGQDTVIKDNNHTENCVIANIVGNTLTMVDNLTYTYMVGDGGEIDAAEAFTLSTLTNNTIKYMTITGTTFYGSDTNSTLRSTTNPLNGGTNWGTSKQMGRDAYDIVDVKAYGGLIYVKKSDSTVHYLDSSAAVQVLVNGQANLSGTNAPRMFVWREESLVIPYGIQGLLYYDGTTITHIEASLYSQGVADFIGQVQAVTGDDQWLYVVVDNSAKIETMAVQYTDGEWKWHTQNEITLTNCQSASISSVYKKRMWIGSDTGSEAIYYVPITTKYGSITSDTDMTYQTGGYFITPWLHMNLRGDKKAFNKITLTMSGTTANVYWRAYYQKLGDGSTWTEIASTGKFKTSPTTSAYLPDDASSAHPTTTMIRLKFEGVTNSTSTTPVLLGYDLRGVWYPTERKLIACRVVVDDNLITNQGMPDMVLGSTLRSTLDNLNSGQWWRAFYPPYWASSADTVYVKKLPLTYGATQLEMVRDDKDRNPIWVYNLLLEVIPTS